MSDSIPANAYVIIIGAMKAGTTTLYDMLSYHPAICPSKVKEPAFFVEGQGFDVDKYEDLFEYDDRIHKYCLEASTSYTKSPMLEGVPARMKEYGIEPYFIYSVRNPIDRIESDYNYAHFHEKEWTKDEIMNQGAIYRSMYHMQLQKMMEFYPDKDRYLVVDFNEIVTQPNKLVNNIFVWLGLKELEIEKPKPKNVTKYPSSLERGVKKIISPSFIELIPAFLKDSLKKILRNNSTSRKKTLTEEQKIKLREQLRPDIEQFGKEFNFNIENWGF